MRTPLGRKLTEIRRKAILNGMKLLSDDEILAEVRRRRGECTDAVPCNEKRMCRK